MAWVFRFLLAYGQDFEATIDCLRNNFTAILAGDLARAIEHDVKEVYALVLKQNCLNPLRQDRRRIPTTYEANVCLSGIENCAHIAGNIG